MLQTLEKSEKFQNEYNLFKEKIENIDNDKIKNDLNILLTKLLSEVRAIDNQHRSIYERRYQPSMTDDSRSKIIEIRKKISKTLDDWEKSKK